MTNLIQAVKDAEEALKAAEKKLELHGDGYFYMTETTVRGNNHWELHYNNYTVDMLVSSLRGGDLGSTKIWTSNPNYKLSDPAADLSFMNHVEVVDWAIHTAGQNYGPYSKLRRYLIRVTQESMLIKRKEADNKYCLAE